MTPTIVAPEAITPDWLSAVLRAGGVEAVVRDFQVRRIGTGQIGQSLKFTLDYAQAPDGAPASLVGKFPAPEPESRNTGVVLGNYIREVNFYRHLAPTAKIATPKCYFTDVDPATSDFVLMMEDLAPAEQGDQLAGCTLDQARLAVLEAANLHASHWDDPAIDQLEWVSGTRVAGLRGSADPATIGNLWRAFCDRYADRLEDDCRAVGDLLTSNWAAYDGWYQGPRSLVHIDFRPDNMMFATAAGGRPITVLDWQSLAWGCGVTDVAYFLAGALNREDRRRLEKDLLREYHDRLRQLGVEQAFDPLWDAYRSRAFALFMVAFYAAVLVAQTPRGDDMFLSMIRSATDQVQDLDSAFCLR